MQHPDKNLGEYSTQHLLQEVLRRLYRQALPFLQFSQSRNLTTVESAPDLPPAEQVFPRSFIDVITLMNDFYIYPNRRPENEYTGNLLFNSTPWDRDGLGASGHVYPANLIKSRNLLYQNNREDGFEALFPQALKFKQLLLEIANLPYEGGIPIDMHDITIRLGGSLPLWYFMLELREMIHEAFFQSDWEHAPKPEFLDPRSVIVIEDLARDLSIPDHFKNDEHRRKLIERIVSSRHFTRNGANFTPTIIFLIPEIPRYQMPSMQSFLEELRNAFLSSHSLSRHSASQPQTRVLFIHTTQQQLEYGAEEAEIVGRDKKYGMSLVMPSFESFLKLAPEGAREAVKSPREWEFLYNVSRGSDFELLHDVFTSRSGQSEFTSDVFVGAVWKYLEHMRFSPEYVKQKNMLIFAMLVELTYLQGRHVNDEGQVALMSLNRAVNVYDIKRLLVPLMKPYGLDSTFLALMHAYRMKSGWSPPKNWEGNPLLGNS